MCPGKVMSRTHQLITYMGNKRKLVSAIETVIVDLKTGLGKDKISIAEPFSGSGVVSRMLRDHADSLYVNDIASYAEDISWCYLPYRDPEESNAIVEEIEKANVFVDSDPDCVEPWMQMHWTCQDENHVDENERLYYTLENARRIDGYRYYVDNICHPRRRPALMGPLLYQASVHTNTNGNFSGFYRSKEGTPWGGDRSIDIKRITTLITLSPPALPAEPLAGELIIGRADAKEWISSLPPVDVVYIDPPYNKHPYATYYFMLELISNWDSSIVIPPTTRGQPQDWTRSPFNSFVHAKTAMLALLKSIKAKYIVLSYNNRGIIEQEEMIEILEQVGSVNLIELSHNTYNKMQGIAAKKRTKPDKKTVEQLWIVECQ